MREKRTALERVLGEMGPTLVAFSGGLDSGYLLHVAHRAVSERLLAITARSASYPEREMQEAVAFCEARGIEHLIVDSHEIENPEYASNPTNRCYFCKSELFEICDRIAAEQGFSHVAYGAITDDLGDHRPGMTAAHEHRVRAPLVEAGLSKAEIRTLAKEEAVELWDKPSFACLASRFPYGTSIDTEKLQKIDRCEAAVRALGFRQLRARFHENLVRLEVEPQDILRMAEPGMRARVVAACREAGFTFVAVDLVGYRSGSLNETLPIL